eukprot:g15329.t1
MKTYGLAPTLCAIAVQFLVTLTACCRNHCLFKLALRLQVLTGLVGVGLMAWGWVEYSQTEETPCVGTGDINPRTLALVFLIFGSIGAPGVLTAALMRGCCGDVNERKMVNGSDTGINSDSICNGQASGFVGMKKLRRNKKKPVKAELDLPGDPLKRQAAQAVLKAVDEEGVLMECLPEWHRQFKPQLGRFRTFLKTLPNLFSITDIPGDCFVVSRANGLPPPSFALKDRRCWRRAVRKAWRRYCEEVSSPSVEEFKCHLPMTGSQLVPSEKSATEPSMVKSRFLRTLADPSRPLV